MAVSVKTKDHKLRLLLADHQDGNQEQLQRLIAAAGYLPDITRIESTAQLGAALASLGWDALICADNEPALPLSAVLQHVAKLKLDLPILILAATGEEEHVIRAIQNGAHDCFGSDRLQRLVPALEREVREARHRADHRAALEMIKASEDRFRALASNMPGMVFQLARDANGEMRFLYASEGGHKLLGLNPHELLGGFDRFIDVIAAEDRAALLAALSTSAEELAIFNWEGRIRHRGHQKSKWANLRSSPQRLSDGSIHWHGIATDITRSKETEAALRRSREQLAELSSYLEAAKEEERERIARDIHDELGSILVAIKIEAALLAGKLPRETPHLAEKAQAIEALLDQAMGTASRVARELRPGILKEFGLQAALECQAEDFAQRTGIGCRFQCEDDIDLDEQRSLALFRIVQEALTNVAKHAHASLVALRLYRDGRHLVLEVRDNGRGISEREINKPKSFGIRGIRERSRSLGGEFRIEAGEQGGTHIALRLPLHFSSAQPPGEEAIQQNLF
ncbi:MAG: histidine kinase [Rhodocyclaceae bacterium]|nr:histidine kinase [Rhodocyclaceae bacterium]